VKSVKLRIPGEFEDAFIYMGRLLLLGANATVHSIRLSQLLDRLAAGRRRDLLRVLFERNDNLGAKGLIAAAGTARAANRVLAGLVSEDLIADPKPESEIVLDVDYSVPLDFLVYNRRAYFATDQGLISQDVDFDSSAARRVGISERRTDPACLAVTARFGAVNASCEDNGLFQSLDEFGWLGSPRRRKMTHIADESRRTSWLHEGFVNYTDSHSFSIFDTRLQTIPVTSADERERHAVVAIGKSDEDASVRNELQQRDIEPSDVLHLWSSLSGVFVQSKSNLVFVRTRTDETDGHHSKVVSLGRGFQSILWAGTFGRGTIIETDDAVIAFENHQTYVIENQPAIAVKTFPSSRWYRRVVATVLEDEVVLSSVLYDYMLNLEG
jgi:hypothetical protein